MSSRMFSIVVSAVVALTLHGCGGDPEFDCDGDCKAKFECKDDKPVFHFEGCKQKEMHGGIPAFIDNDAVRTCDEVKDRIIDSRQQRSRTFVCSFAETTSTFTTSTSTSSTFTTSTTTIFLPRCLCDLPSGVRGALCIDDGNCSRNEDDSRALWDCHLAGSICEARAADCTSQAVEDLDYCALLGGQHDCEEQRACRWSPVAHTLLWECTSDRSDLQAGCSLSSQSREVCVGQRGCLWNSSLEDWRGSCLNNGNFEGCIAAASVESGGCAVLPREQCEVQIACNWSPDCICKPEFFGGRCESSVASRTEECLGVEAIEDTCAGIILGSALARAEPRCAASAVCQDWYSAKIFLTTAFEATVIDICNDFLAVVLGVALAMRLLPEHNFFAMVMMLAFFTVDMVSEILVFTSASGSSDVINAVVEASCFTPGAGLKTMILLADAIESTQVLAMVNIALAVAGIITEVYVLWGARAPKLGSTDSITMLDSKVEMLVAFAAVVELGISLFDVITNQLESMSDIDSVEDALLGLGELGSGTVCFRWNSILSEEYGTPTRMGVQRPWSGVAFLYFAIAFGVVVAYGVVYVVCKNCLRRPADAAWNRELEQGPMSHPPLEDLDGSHPSQGPVERALRLLEPDQWS